MSNQPIPVKPFFNQWRIGLFSVFALSVALYFPSLNGKLVWDDYPLVMGTISGTRDLLGAFTHPFGNFFRPFTSASFAIENIWAHGNPFFYHQTNLVLHAVTALLVAYFALLLTKNNWAGICSGLFFAAQPMQVGAAAWIGGRTDVLSTFFLALLLVSLLRFYQSEKVGWLIAATISFLFAALSKEQAIAIFPAVPLSVFVFGSKKWKDVARITLPFGVATVIYIGMWLIGGPPLRSVPDGVSEVLMRALQTIAHYGVAFIAPNKPALITFTLAPHHGFFWLPLGALLAVAIGYLLRESWKSKRELAWVGICALLVYMPISNLPPVPSLVLGPYRCTLPGLSIACLFGAWLSASVASKRYVLAGILGLNFVASLVVAWWGVHQWLTEEALFDNVVEVDPHFLVGVQIDAHSLEGRGRSKEAFTLTGNALTWLFGSSKWPLLLDQQKMAAITPSVVRRLRTNTGVVQLTSLGALLTTHVISAAQVGRMSEAALVARDALIFTPKDPFTNMLYGRLAMRFDRADATRHLETALALQPDYAECALTLAQERVYEKRYSEAASLLVIALKQMKDSGSVWLLLADVKIALHDYSGATIALDQAERAAKPVRPSDLQQRRDRMRTQATH